MRVITIAENNVVFAIVEDVRFDERKNMYIKQGDQEVLIGFPYKQYELVSIPKEVEPFKYTYEDGKGFAKYTPPIPEDEQLTPMEVMYQEVIQLKFKGMAQENLITSLGEELTKVKLQVMMLQMKGGE